MSPSGCCQVLKFIALLQGTLRYTNSSVCSLDQTSDSVPVFVRFHVCQGPYKNQISQPDDNNPSKNNRPLIPLGPETALAQTMVVVADLNSAPEQCHLQDEDRETCRAESTKKNTNLVT